MFQSKKTLVLKLATIILFLVLIYHHSQLRNIKLELTELNNTFRAENFKLENQIKNLLKSFNESEQKLLKELIKIQIGHETNGVKLFDLTSPLEPANVYDPIKCRKSIDIRGVSTTLCVHDLNDDKFVSSNIWQNGVWEPDILLKFTEYIQKNPDWLVLDVGSQIGQYCLFAAKMGRDVVCLEPFYENLLRIHKAAKLENLADKIILVKNAVSNKRNEIKKLHQQFGNIGGQSLLNHKNEVYSKQNSSSNDKYLVETILLDDIIPYLPKRKGNQEYRKALMKMDIEGYEPFVMKEAKKLFDVLDFQIVFMEFLIISEHPEEEKLVLEMIDFLYSKNLAPYAYNNTKLVKQHWRSWPADFIWRKESSNNL